MLTLEVIREHALALPLLERETLIDQLVSSLGVEVREKWDAAWADESERRIAAYDRGESKAETLDELKRELASE